MNEMLIDELRLFSQGKSSGLRVLVVPDDMAAEGETLTTCIRATIGEGSVLVASEPPSMRPYESIKRALIDGYSRLMGKKSSIGSAIDKGSELLSGIADDLAGGFASVLVKIGIRKITNSPVAPLTRSTLDRETIRGVLKQLCGEHRILLYISQTYRDDPESRRFLSTTIAREMELLLGDRRDRLMVLFTIRRKDLAEELGKELKALVDDCREARLIDVGEVQDVVGDAEGIQHRLRTLKAPELRLLRHVVVFCRAADTEAFDLGTILLAAKVDDRCVNGLQKAGFVRGDHDHALGMLDASCNRYELFEALDDFDEDEFDREEDANPDDAYEAPVHWEIAPATVLLDVLEATKRAWAGPELMLDMAIRTRSSWRVIAWFGKCCDASEAVDSDVSISALLRSKSTKNSELDLDIMIGGDLTTGEWTRFTAGMDAIARKLLKLAEEPWGPVQQALAELLLDCIKTTVGQPDISDEARSAWAAIARRERGFLQVLTSTGHSKLMALGYKIVPRSERNRPGTEFIGDTIRNGTLSEMLVVKGEGRTWLFASNREVLCYPTRVCSRIHEDGTDLADDCEDLSLFFDRDSKWSKERVRVMALCNVPAKLEGLAVVLANPSGAAFVAAADGLPQIDGGRALLSDEAMFEEEPRWAVAINARSDLFVATTGDRIVRLRGEDLLDHRGLIEQLVSLDEDEEITAITAVERLSDFGAYLATVTSGGYGKLVLASEFSYSNIGGRGVRGQKEGARSGHLCTIEAADMTRHIMIGTLFGRVLRLRIADLPVRRREHVGLKLVSLDTDYDDEVTCACVY